jgi:hypothetical protein
MVVNDVKSLVKDLLDAGRLEKWISGLVGRKRREATEGASESMDGYIGMIVVSSARLLTHLYTVGVDTMDDIHLMPALG